MITSIHSNKSINKSINNTINNTNNNNNNNNNNNTNTNTNNNVNQYYANQDMNYANQDMNYVNQDMNSLSFIENIVDSMLNPGHINHSVHLVIHGSLALLLINFIGLYFISKSIHCIILSIITLGLWASITWFLANLQTLDAKKNI